MYAKWATGVGVLISFYKFLQCVELWRACINLNANWFVEISDRMFFQENTAFIDTKKMGIIKKKVRKLEDQLSYESRR